MRQGRDSECGCESSNFVHPDPDQGCDKVCSMEAAQLIQHNERTVDEDDPRGPLRFDHVGGSVEERCTGSGHLGARGRGVELYGYPGYLRLFGHSQE